MSSLLDQTEDAPLAPVAVVGRPGESPEQYHLRHQGFSDAETGYVAPGYGGRRGYGATQSPLARSANIALRQQQMADEGVREDREWRKLSLDEKNAQIKSDENDVNSRIHDAAINEKKAALDQTAWLLSERNDIAAQNPPGTVEFYKAMVPLYSKYPAAFHGNPRVAEMWQHDTDNLTRLSNLTPTPAAAPEGFEIDRQNIPTPGGGSVTLKPKETPATVATKAPTQAQISQHQGAFDRAHDELQGNIALANDILDGGDSLPPAVLGRIETAQRAIQSTGNQLAKADATTSDAVNERNTQAGKDYATFRAKFDEQAKKKMIEAHDSAEADLQAFKDPETDGPVKGKEADFRKAALKLNAIKAHLGYAQIDPKTGKEIPAAASAPAATPQPSATPAAAPSAPPHPLEGQTVRQKSTGATGRIVNGQFVPDTAATP